MSTHCGPHGTPRHRALVEQLIAEGAETACIYRRIALEMAKVAHPDKDYHRADKDPHALTRWQEENPAADCFDEASGAVLFNYYFDFFRRGRMGVVPDAFKIVPEEKKVIVYEVEITSPAKMAQLVEVWWILDCESWFMELVRIDASGHRDVLDDDALMEWFYQINYRPEEEAA